MLHLQPIQALIVIPGSMSVRNIMTDPQLPSDSPLSIDRRLSLLVSSVSDYAIYMLDPGGYITSWNAGAEHIKGYKAEEIIGSHFSRFYTEEDRQAGVPERALRTAREEGKFEAESWRVRKDGSRFWASVAIDPIRDENGQLIGFAKVTRDVTERRAAQEALRESEERFRLLVQGVTDYALYMLSPEGMINNWNFGAERIKGYSADEVIGTHFSRFYTEQDRNAGLPQRGLGIAAREGRYENEGWRVRKDGERFWAHVVIDAIYDDGGKLVGFAKITRDITEKKRAAEALEQANAALFQAQKMEAIGQLTGGVAHDFNNLLAVMSNGLDVLSLRLQAHAEVKLIASMRRAVERGAALTQQLLSFARQQPLKVENSNLNGLIRGFEGVLQRALNPTISFEVNYAAHLPAVSIDAARFEAALLNLVVNARDAMPNGGQLRVSTKKVELRAGEVGRLDSGSYVMVAVSDTGSGMPPEVVARALEPFFTTKEVGKGTGLGLSQVYGFITQSGGEVTLHSEVGKGTTVCLYLPATSGAADSKSGTSGTDHRDDDEDGTQRDIVLVVDDEPDLLDVGAELFRSLGYEVLTAGDGQQACRILKQRKDIGILFSDVVMPGSNGVEVARAARNLIPGIKVILASGYPMQALKTAHGEIDEFSVMTKPYRLSDLMSRLKTVH